MKMFFNLKMILWGLLFGLFANASFSAQDKPSIEFIEASPIKREPPVYPFQERASNNAGMAEVEMMIDDQGKVFAPIILRSTAEKFEKAALEAVKKYVYEPATYNGKPVQSRASIRIMFRMSGEKEGVTRNFARLYKKVSKELAKAETDKTKVEKMLQQMKSAGDLTRYALVRYNLVALHFAIGFGDLNQQIEATRKLLMFDQRMTEKGRLLDTDTSKSVRNSLFFALVRTQRYAEAMDVYKTIRKENVDDIPELEKIASQITELKNAGQSSVININIGPRGYAIERLLNKTMIVSDVDGNVNAIKFRCDRRFQEMKFQPDAEYLIPATWGDCFVELVGEAGASATLTQLSDST